MSIFPHFSPISATLAPYKIPKLIGFKQFFSKNNVVKHIFFN